MRLFRVFNSNPSPILICAASETRAREIALQVRHVRSLKGIRKIIDITDDYVSHHGPRGFVIEDMEEGWLFQRINGPSSTWACHLNN